MNKANRRIDYWKTVNWCPSINSYLWMDMNYEPTSVDGHDI